ncbi:hypothetical protein FGG08_000541 [Glutinoglossum americanum]|uniref:Uncharacterized protein n=1 Tax=Glutinoglossum americanum TaxID=1670608 RepID=A0A9P8L5Y9_9PEZI|nr:hypothetical protein FGG08_000541 [Glutinoglossum americanum]
MNPYYIPGALVSFPLYVPRMYPNENPPPYAIAVQQIPAVAGPRLQARPHPVPHYFAGPIAPAAPPAPPAAPAAPAAGVPPNDDAPPGARFGGNRDGLPRGASYLYPAKHTTIHVVKGNFDPLTNPGTEFNFWVFKVATILTIGDLILQLGGRAGGNDKCGITELLEVGDGSWAKGITIFQKDDQKKQTMAAVGWDETRGAAKGPVWLKVHKG